MSRIRELPTFHELLTTNRWRPRPKPRRRSVEDFRMAVGRWYGLRKPGYYARCIQHNDEAGWAFPYRCLVFRPGPNGRLVEEDARAFMSYAKTGRYLVFAESPYDAVRELKRWPRGAPEEYRR